MLLNDAATPETRADGGVCADTGMELNEVTSKDDENGTDSDSSMQAVQIEAETSPTLHSQTQDA